MIGRRLILACGVTAILCAAVPVNAGTIPITNADFESPAITNPPYAYGQIYDPLDFPSLLPWVVWQGALTNPTMLDAALPGNGYGIDMTGHGAQCAYLYCGDPNQTNKPYWYQNLSTNFEAGKTYTLGLSAAMVETAANPGQTLLVRLGYWSGTELAYEGPTVVAEQYIAYDQITSSWDDYSFSSNAVSGDAVGKPIVVYIGQGAYPSYVTGPQYYVDNVSLTAVPEPGTVALLGTGILGLLAYAWRSAKKG
jgi:hypothetical protein